MLMVWIGLAVLVAGLVGGAVFAVRRGLGAYQQFRRTTDELTERLESVAQRAEDAARRAEELAAGSERLAGAAARLAVSRARLSVLVAALQDVRNAIGRVTAVYPRK